MHFDFRGNYKSVKPLASMGSTNHSHEGLLSAMKAIQILKKRRQQDIKNKEENLDIEAIKDPRLEWQKYPQYQILQKERKVCLCWTDKEYHL